MRFFRASAILFYIVRLHAEPPQSTAERYRETAGRLIRAALSDPTGYQKLTYLCDRIGSRISGGEALPQAISWVSAQMRRDGLSNVSSSPVRIQTWIRGKESLSILQPVRREVPMLVEAEVVTVGSTPHTGALWYHEHLSRFPSPCSRM